MKVIAKCYHCGKNRIVKTSVEYFKCPKCDKRLNYEKAKIMAKPTDDEQELREKLGDLEEKRAYEHVDSDSLNVPLEDSKTPNKDPYEFALNIIEREGPIEFEELEAIWKQNDLFDDDKIYEIIEIMKEDGRIYRSPKGGLKRSY